MSQSEKGGVIESKIISNKILQEGDSLGLSRAYYAKTWGYLKYFLWNMVKG